MDSIPIYLRNRHEPDKISYKTPQLAHILDVTNGCIVYQEPVSYTHLDVYKRQDQEAVARQAGKAQDPAGDRGAHIAAHDNADGLMQLLSLIHIYLFCGC